MGGQEAVAERVPSDGASGDRPGAADGGGVEGLALSSSVGPYLFREPGPRHHQLRGMQELVAADGVWGLCWEVGSGKSRTTIDYLGWLAHSTQQQVRVLVTAPRNVQDVWPQEVAKWGSPSVEMTVEVLTGSIEDKAQRLKDYTNLLSGPRVHVMVVNYEALSSRRKIKGRATLHSDMWVDAIKKFAPHVLVCDESHFFKSPTSNVGRLMYRVAKNVKRRILLTGTPQPHSPGDLFAQMRVLDDTVFSTFNKPWSHGQFMSAYSKQGGYMGKQVMAWRNLDDLEKRMATRSSSVRTRDCVDLPPVQDIEVPLRLSAREQRAYDRIKKEMVLELESGTLMSAPSMLTLRLRLRQLACGFVKDDESHEVEWIGGTRLEAAAERVEALLATENRVVVFGWARPELDELGRRLGHLGDVMVITGDTPDNKRREYRARFVKRDETKRVIVAQWRTMSTGVNELVTASHAVFMSLPETRADYIQARGRLERPGQTGDKICFHILMGQGTIDEVIYKSHLQKTSLEESLLTYLRKA